MSFILDALRKSENARQRQGGPALTEVPIARRKESRPWWIWAVAALLGINLIVLLVVLTRDREPAPTQAPATPAASTAPAATAPLVAAAPAPAAAPVSAAPAIVAPVQPVLTPVAAAPPAGTIVAGRSLAEEAASAGTPIGDPDAPTGSVAAAGNVPQREPIVRSLTPGTPAGTSQTGGEENLPTLNELTGDRAVGMPEMHLDIHVYSTKPAERFVFINMRKYVEGATLTEGPVVERIRTDGVVLNQRGFRFVLPRQ